MAMTKIDIANRITEQTGASKAQALDMVEGIIEILKACLEADEEVLVSRFGKFVVQEKSSRPGRNPVRGDAMQLRPRKRVAFKCSGKLRTAINVFVKEAIK